MKTLARYFFWMLGSVVYWVVAVLLVMLATWVVGGDCGLEQAKVGLEACGREKRWALFGALAVATLVYIFAVRGIHRRHH